MKHGNSAGFQNSGNLRADPDDGMIRIQRAAELGLLIFPAGNLGIGLRGVGLDNQDLRAVGCFRQRKRSGQQRCFVIGKGATAGDGDLCGVFCGEIGKGGFRRFRLREVTKPKRRQLP